MNGMVKMVQQDKGFGFITGEDGIEYFFHYTALKNCQMGSLRKGDSVTFEENEGSKGPRAEDIYV